MRKHLHPRYTLLFALLCFYTVAFAQSPGWYIPQNGYLNSAFTGRYDDIYFIAPDTGFLVSSDGALYKTYDGANIWNAKYIDTNSGAYFRSIEFSKNGQYGIAGCLDGTIYRTDDRGETWTEITASISDTGSDRKKICGLAHWNNNFYGVGWWGSSVARFYKSIDAGITWTTTYIDTSLASGLVDIVFTAADTCFATGFRKYNANSIQESVVLKSTNAGQTWTKVFSDTVIGGRIWKIQAITNTLLVGSIEPVYADTVAMIKSTDGGNTWHILSAGSQTSSSWGTQGIGFVSPQHGWLGGYYHGMFETFDGGLTWTHAYYSFNTLNRFFVIDSSRVYASGLNVYKYEDSTAAIFPTSVNNTQQVNAPSIHKLFPVSPNPAKGRIKIEFDLDNPTNTLLEVVCLDGHKTFPVMNGRLGKGHYTYYWDGSSAAKGNYIIWLGTDEAPLVNRFTLY